MLLKPLRGLVLLACGLLAGAGSSFAQANAYDLFGQVLAPYTQLLSGGGQNHAVQVIMRVEKTGNAEPRVVGAYITAALEMPDKLRITAPLQGSTITICRKGDEIWAHPASRLKALLGDRAAAEQLPKADSKFRLEPFQLPVSQQQLAFLPVLFRIKEAEGESIDGTPCRVLDIQLQKELAKALEVEKSSARLWVDEQLNPTRVAIRSEQGEATLRITKVKFSPELAPIAWEPTLEQAGDVMKVPPKLYDQVVRALMGRGSNEK
jgi:hypothetical protein